MQVGNAIAGALYFQRPPAELVSAFEEVLATDFMGATLGQRLDRMRSAPVGNVRFGKQAEFTPRAFIKRLSGGRYRCVLAHGGREPSTERGVQQADSDYLHFYTDCAPLERLDIDKRQGWRYQTYVLAGSAVVQEVGAAAIADLLVRLAHATEIAAGVVAGYPTLSGVDSLVAGGNFDSQPKELAERGRRAWHQRKKWGPKIRGPEWGTFLSARHVRELGGHEALGARCAVARHVRLESGGAYLQVTADPTALERAQMDALRAVLAPVMIED